MKMGFLFSGIFWGSVLILIGLSILLKVVFNIDLPIFRIVMGLVFIVIGIQILFGKTFFQNPFHPGKHDVVFSEGKLNYNPGETEYNTVFGKSILDLRSWNEQNGGQKLEINTVFGQNRILLSDKMPVKIKAVTVFGNTIFPGQNQGGFGNHPYTTKSYKEGKPHLFIELHTVFGETEVME